MKRWDSLRAACTVGKVASILVMIFGFVTFFTTGGKGIIQGIALIGSGIGGFISCEAVMVLIALEENSRAIARLLRDDNKTED